MKRTSFQTILFICLLVVLSIAAARMAYTGPKRTVTIYEENCKIILEECRLVNGSYRWPNLDAWSCGNEDKPWLFYSNYKGECDYYSLHNTRWGKHTTLTEKTVTYPPATVSGSLSCPTPGQNGWCAGNGQMTMTGAEPVSGYSIYAIEGRQNGANFACTGGSTCSVPLAEGENNFDFWALSTFTDTSSLASLAGKQDSVPPQITTNLNGVLAASGWYRSNVTFTASAADATSGLASFTCLQDGTAPGSCASGSVSGEGNHQLTFNALDQAGNPTQWANAVNIDTRPPTLNVPFTAQNGQNGWYLSASVSASAVDPLPGSGSAALQFALDGGPWTDFAGVYTFPDGEHTVDFRAVDLAENSAQAAPITVKVDASDPVIDTNISATAGKNGWYISAASVSGSASDAVSGMSTFESNFDSSGWNAYTSPLTVNDGSHTVSFYAEDAAGQNVQSDLTVNVDTRAPQISGSISAGTSGQNGWYTSPVTLNGSAADPTPGSGVASFNARVDGGAPADGSAPISLTDGQHTIVFDAEDTAGLTASLTRTIDVDSVPPSLTVDTSLPVWNRGSVSFAGTAADALSGLARVEISTDNGATWRSTTGSAAWTVDWDTTTAADGDRVVRIRSVDTAGLTHESAFYVGVDNHGPEISAPANWSVDDTVTLAVTDAGSGVDEVVVKILDPLNRYPTRVLHFEGGVFPLAFTWDRHFEDGTLAPHGEYTVLITAADNFGNESVLNAKVGVPLIGHIFGGYNTATPLPTLLPTLTPTPRGLAPTLAPTSTAAATELAFGVPVTGAGGTSSGAPASPVTHSSPPSLGFTSFIQDVFFPASGSTAVETTTSSPAQQPLSAASAGVLFGSAATAATTGLAAYYLQKKKEEEEARREAILARIAAEKAAEERRERIAERIRQQEAIAAAKAAKAAQAVQAAKSTSTAYAGASTSQTKTQTKVIYMREKVDPTFENITGKPSMSMSDALKITHPQTKSTTKTKTNKVVYNREKYDVVTERKTKPGYTWNAKDGVVASSAVVNRKKSSDKRDDVCYVSDYGYIIEPGPTLTPTATPTPVPTPVPTLSNDQIADGLDLGSDVLSITSGAAKVPIPLADWLAMLSQSYRDQGKGYKLSYLATRVIISLAEGGITIVGSASFGVAAGCIGLGSLAADLIFATAVYTFAYFVIHRGFGLLNEKIVYPLIEQRFNVYESN
jgi:hypothetical protein